MNVTTLQKGGCQNSNYQAQLPGSHQTSMNSSLPNLFKLINFKSFSDTRRNICKLSIWDLPENNKDRGHTE